MGKTIYQKLAEAKKEIGKISKDSTNPFFKSKYFDINSLLEHVEPILEKHGLMVLQPIYGTNLQTEIIDVETGETLRSQIDFSPISDPQKLGSAITYYRRYTLQSILALQAEDDDANLASKPYKKTSNNSNNDDKKWLNKFEKGTDTVTREWANIEAKIDTGVITKIGQVIDAYKVSKELQTELNTLL